MAGDSLTLVVDGQSEYSIVIPSGATSHEKKAAEELSYYIEKISGAMLPVVAGDEKTGQKEILIGDNRHLIKAGIKTDFKKLDEDGYHILTLKDYLIIAGGEAKGALYGVYRFLEDFLGCRMYTPDDIYIPLQETISIPGIDLLSNPAFDMRTLYFPAKDHQDYADWHGFDSHKDRIREWGSWVHTFKDLLPADEYFNTHAECF
jgi:hypothetical protein